MPPRPANAARTHRPRGPSGAARGCEAWLRPENHRVFRIIITHPRLRIDGKRDGVYRASLRRQAGHAQSFDEAGDEFRDDTLRRSAHDAGYRRLAMKLAHPAQTGARFLMPTQIP